MIGLAVIVCGGRDYGNQAKVDAVLDLIHAEWPIGIIKHGGATGADALAAQWAFKRGVQTMIYRADWAAHGNAAGPIRNEAMAYSGADLCIAFPGGRGTANMLCMARKYGIKTQEETDE